MTIKMIQTLSTTQRCYVKGNVYDVDDAEATEFIAKGLAEEGSDVGTMQDRYRINGLLGFPIPPTETP